MKKKKLNCWEYKKCGREAGVPHMHDLGICPVTVETKLDGVHEGTNAGRACWIVAGSLCKGEVQGSFAQKYKNCEICDFYRMVQQEEFPGFTLSAVLLKKLNR